MRNIKLTTSFVLIVFYCFNLLGQDFPIASAHLHSDYKLPKMIDNQLKNKMQRVLSKQGVTADEAVFALVPEISIISERTLSGIPSISEMEYELTFKLMNVFDGKVFDSYTYDIESKGANKINAISVGFKKVSLNKPEFKSFLEQAKEKVISYYEKELPKMIRKAKVAMNTKDYGSALSILSEIPDVIPSYDKVAKLMEYNYDMYVKSESEALLQQARALWASNKDEETAAKVAYLLSEIPVNSPVYKETKEFIEQLDKYTTIKEMRNRRIEEKLISNAHQLSKAKIEAAKAIGMAYAKNSGTKVILWR